MDIEDFTCNSFFIELKNKFTPKMRFYLFLFFTTTVQREFFNLSEKRPMLEI